MVKATVVTEYGRLGEHRSASALIDRAKSMLKAHYVYEQWQFLIHCATHAWAPRQSPLQTIMENQIWQIAAIRPCSHLHEWIERYEQLRSHQTPTKETARKRRGRENEDNIKNAFVLQQRAHKSSGTLSAGVWALCSPATFGWTSEQIAVNYSKSLQFCYWLENFVEKLH